jgi:hypothetical protein
MISINPSRWSTRAWISSAVSSGTSIKVQDFCLCDETANTPRCGGFGIRSVVAADGQANAKSKAALATIFSRAAFDLKFLTELAARV